jgi:hypothetical protein
VKQLLLNHPPSDLARQFPQTTYPEWPGVFLFPAFSFTIARHASPPQNGHGFNCIVSILSLLKQKLLPSQVVVACLLSSDEKQQA